MTTARTLPTAREVVAVPEAADHVALDYEDRLLRRKRLVSAAGVAFLVDLPETVSVEEGQGFRLEDGREIAVRAAPEVLVEVRGDLPRLAWHIGNRHTPCRIEPDRLLIRDDHVLCRMLTQLGAELKRIEAPFAPEGGAYGHGRTFGHDHGHDHDHAHGHHHHHDHG